MRRRLLSAIVLGLLLESTWGLDAVEPSSVQGDAGPPEASIPDRPGMLDLAAMDATLDFPIHLVPATDSPLVIEKTPIEGGDHCVSVMGRVYLWWEVQDRQAGVLRRLELTADNILVFLGGDAGKAVSAFGQAGQELSADWIRGLYLSGDVVMAEGLRQIRCDQMYFDIRSSKAVAVNTVLRTFDPQRQIPIYIRAARLRLVAQDVFTADDVLLTTSEFYKPQVAFTAAHVIVTDKTPADLDTATFADRQFDAQMKDVGLKVGGQTLFHWPKLETGLGRPEVPLRGVRVGNDSTWGTSVETDWHMARLLGLREPEGADGTVSVDYYGDRGPGVGLEINYERADYFGRVLGYLIEDSGTDTLGRIAERRNIEPPDETRGRFTAQHRQFLPYQWQLTAEISAVSDENFMEQYYRNEFNTEKEQETLLHVKRVWDNRGLSVLAKSRINDFMDTVEQMPDVQFHWAGQSFWHDRLTLYSDTQVGRFRDRFGEDGPGQDPFNIFNFAASRSEMDAPIRLRSVKVVPFVAGTFGFEDGAGFYTGIDGRPSPAEAAIGVGEAGFRLAIDSFWKVYPRVQSRLLDLRQMRHVIRPSLTAISYVQSDAVAEQRDVLGLSLSQKFQTKRGSGPRERVVDWLTWNIGFVWVENPMDEPGVDYLLWNRPYVPMTDLASGGLPPKDRRSSVLYGPARNTLTSDMALYLTDSTAILADLYYDPTSGVARQANLGISHVRWPDLSYYIGSRYLRDFDNRLGQKGVNAFTFAATYKLDERYAVVLAQQLDLEHGTNIRSDIALVRTYHRLSYGLAFSLDESLNQTSVVFGLWPQGMPELGLGLNRYMDLGL